MSENQPVVLRAPAQRIERQWCRNYIHDAPVNDVVIHPNQGELISCDQAGSVKIWDLGENTCTHELVRLSAGGCSPITT